MVQTYLNQYCEKHQRIHERSVPYAPEQNEIAEKRYNIKGNDVCKS